MCVCVKTCRKRPGCEVKQAVCQPKDAVVQPVQRCVLNNRARRQGCPHSTVPEGRRKASTRLSLKPAGLGVHFCWHLQYPGTCWAINPKLNTTAHNNTLPIAGSPLCGVVTENRGKERAPFHLQGSVRNSPARRLSFRAIGQSGLPVAIMLGSEEGLSKTNAETPYHREIM